MLANPTNGILEERLRPLPKQTINKQSRIIRFLLSSIDPRSWMHLFKVLNYYNYTHVTPRRQLKIGKNAAISPTVSFANAQNITFGDNAHLGAGCTIWAGTDHGTISAGDDLLLGPGVVMTAASYRFNDGTPVTNQLMDEKPIQIGNDVWIGANAVILPGATILDGAIIAAGAVVRGQVSKGQIMAGVPAKPVGERQITRP